MADERIVWHSQCGNHETVRDAAERFVREYFNTERDIVFVPEEVGLFRFADGYWMYRISCECGWWKIVRTDDITPQGKERRRARRESAVRRNEPSD